MRKTNKLKTVNVERIKPFFEETQTEHALDEPLDFAPNDAFNQAGPTTRARAKLIELQKQVSLLINEISECDLSADADADYNELSINAISEDLRSYLMSIARKLLISDTDNFHELTPEEQQIWNSFPTSEIYEFLTGLPDEVPEFKYDWITPSPSAKLTIFDGAVVPPQPPLLPALPPPPDVAVPNDPQPGPSGTPAPATRQTHIEQYLRPRKQVNYKDLHTGKSVFKAAKERASKRWSKVTTATTSLFGSPSSSSAPK